MERVDAVHASNQEDSSTSTDSVGADKHEYSRKSPPVVDMGGKEPEINGVNGSICNDITTANGTCSTVDSLKHTYKMTVPMSLTPSTASPPGDDETTPLCRAPSTNMKRDDAASEVERNKQSNGHDRNGTLSRRPLKAQYSQNGYMETEVEPLQSSGSDTESAPEKKKKRSKWSWVTYSIFLATGFIIGYFVTSVLNKESPHRHLNADCLPPLSKRKFYNYTRMAINGRPLDTSRWKRRDKQNNEDIRSEVWTIKLDDYNHGLGGWFTYKKLPPSVIADTYCRADMQPKWDNIGKIKILTKGGPANNLTQPYPGPREKPEELYVVSELPWVPDTDKVTRRATQIFRDTKTKRIVVASVQRDVGGRSETMYPKGAYKRTYSLDLGVVIASNPNNPNETTFFAYTRESLPFDIHEDVVGYAVKYSLGEYFRSFHDVAKQYARTRDPKARDFFKPAYKVHYPDIEEWAPPADQPLLDEEEIEYKQCVKNKGRKSAKVFSKNTMSDVMKQGQKVMANVIAAFSATQQFDPPQRVSQTARPVTEMISDYDYQLLE